MKTIPFDGGFLVFAAVLVLGVLALGFGLAKLAGHFEKKG